MIERLFDCKASAYSVYFEGGFDPDFRKRYKGVLVNGRGYGGYGHFAIRKPMSKFRNLLPKFVRKLFPIRSVIWKRDCEKMYVVIFDNAEKSIEVVADFKIPLCKKLGFDGNTYLDLKAHVPEFLEMVGYTFETVEKEGRLTLKIKYRHYEIVDGKCVIPQGVTEIPAEMYFGFKDLQELVLPDGLTGIGDRAFLSCTALKSVTIPASVKSIGRDAFMGCFISDFHLLSDNPDNVPLADAMRELRSFEHITLHVPAGSEEAYRRHPFLGKFKVVSDCNYTANT